MTEFHIYGTKPGVGRPKQFAVRITLPMSAEMAGRVDRALEEDEPRLELIRKALEAELKRRERAKPKG